MKRISAIGIVIMILLASVVMGEEAPQAEQFGMKDLIMQVAENQIMQLLPQNEEAQQIATIYNMAKDPGSVPSNLVTMAVSQSPELKTAYSITNTLMTADVGSVVGLVCTQGNEQGVKGLCDAYTQGMQIYGAAKNPQAAAQQYALAEISKNNPEISGMITQITQIKEMIEQGGVNPARLAMEALRASSAALPKASPATTKAVAEPKWFEGKFDAEIAENCMIGFSVNAQDLEIGQITNCRSDKQTDISILFDQEGLKATISGMGCAFSKRNDKIYLYNGESCSMAIGKWNVLGSEKRTFMTFIEREESWALFEGRFIPKTDPHAFMLENEEYSIPKGGVLYYRNSKFDVDLSSVKTKEFSVSSYKDGKNIGTTTVRQTGDTAPVIIPKLRGYDIIGEAEITTPSQRINMLRGDITINQDGSLASIGDNALLEVWLPEIDRSLVSPEIAGLKKPQNMIKLTTAQDAERTAFSTTCGEKGEQGINVCANDNNELEISLSDTKGIKVEHFKSYTTTEQTTLKEVVTELKGSSSAFRQSRLRKKICDLNPELQEDGKCNIIGPGEEILIRTKSLKVRGDGDAKMTISEGSSKLSSLTTSVIEMDAITVNPTDKTIRSKLAPEVKEEFLDSFETSLGILEERQEETEIRKEGIGSQLPKEVTEDFSAAFKETLTVLDTEYESRDVMEFRPDDIEPDSEIEPIPTGGVVRITGMATKGKSYESKTSIVLNNPEAERIELPATEDEGEIAFDQLTAVEDYNKVLETTTLQALAGAKSDRSLLIGGSRSGYLEHPTEPTLYRRFTSGTGSCITTIDSNPEKPDSTTIIYVDANCDMRPGTIYIRYPTGEKACSECKDCANPCRPRDIKEATKLNKLIDRLMVSH